MIDTSQKWPSSRQGIVRGFRRLQPRATIIKSEHVDYAKGPLLRRGNRRPRAVVSFFNSWICPAW